MWPKCLTFLLVRLANISEEMLLIPNMLRRMYTYKTHFFQMTSQHASLELINCCLQIDLLWIISAFACCSNLKTQQIHKFLVSTWNINRRRYANKTRCLFLPSWRENFSVIQGSSSQPEQLFIAFNENTGLKDKLLCTWYRSYHGKLFLLIVIHIFSVICTYWSTESHKP